MFRDDFVWGVASSSYQVEGTDANDGRGKNVWDAFTEAGRIFENQNAYTTCDHMHHYKEDYGHVFCRKEPVVSMKKRSGCTVI